MNRFLRNFIAAFVILFISAIIGCNISAKPIGKAHKRDTCILQNPPLFNSSPALCKGLFPFKNTDYNQIYCAIPNVRKGTYTPSSLCQGVLSFSNLDLQQIYCALLADSGGGGGIPASDSLNGSTFLQGSSQFLTNYSGWTTQGNAGTTVGTNFIGTTDNQPFEIKTNNTLSGWIDYTTPYNTVLGYNCSISGLQTTAVGYNALASNTGSYNTAVGLQSLFFNAAGRSNTAVGNKALYTNLGSSGNTAVGYCAGLKNIASWNCFFGDSAGFTNSSGTFNSFFGFKSGVANTTGNNITALGDSSLSSNTTGNCNNATGANALERNTTGYGNTADGFRGLHWNTIGYDNTAIGDSAGLKNTTGHGNIFIGVSSGIANTTASNQLYIGNSLNSTKGYLYNDGTGHITNDTVRSPSWTLAGNAGTTVGTNFIGTTDNQPFEIKVNNIISGLIQPAAGSKDNTGFGGGVFSSLTSLGIANSAFGLQALFTNTSGSENTGMGLQALNSNTTGFDNAALGYGAGHGNTTGSYNTYLGDSTGWNAAKGNYNIYIGYGSGNSNKSLSNNFYWGDSAGHAWTPTSQKFCGDLRPYYSGNYQAGSSGQVLTSQGAGSAPQWTTISGGGGTTLSGGSVGLIPFYKNSTSLRFQGWLAADTVNKYLGVGGSPNALLDIEGAYANYGQLRINATSGGTASIDFRVGGTNYWQQYATSSAMSFYNFTSGIYPLFQLGQYGDVTIASNSSAPQPLTITCNNNSPKTVSVTNSSNGGSACADQWWINDKTGLTIIGITGSHWGSYAAYPKNGSFIEFGGGGISAITQDSTKPLVFEMNAAKKGFVYSPGIVFDTSAAIGIFSDSLTVNGSTSGSAFFQQPLFGTFKEVDVQCSSLVGTATYTFPFPFKNIPSIIATNNVAVGIVTSISTTSVTLTGVTTSGFIELKGR